MAGSKRSLKELFRFTSETMSDAYEVVRTVGATVKTAKGYNHCRIEVVKRNGERLFAPRVWIIDKQGRWKIWALGEQNTLNRQRADDALQSMIGYLQQYMPRY